VFWTWNIYMYLHKLNLKLPHIRNLSYTNVLHPPFIGVIRLQKADSFIYFWTSWCSANVLTSKYGYYTAYHSCCQFNSAETQSIRHEADTGCSTVSGIWRHGIHNCHSAFSVKIKRYPVSQTRFMYPQMTRNKFSTTRQLMTLQNRMLRCGPSFLSYPKMYVELYSSYAYRIDLQVDCELRTGNNAEAVVADFK